MVTMIKTNTLASAILDAAGLTTLHGSTGSGKTTALAGIATEAVARGHEVLVIDLAWGGFAFNQIEGVQALTNERDAKRALRALSAERQERPVVLLVEEFHDLRDGLPEIYKLVRKAIHTRGIWAPTVLSVERPSWGVTEQACNAIYLAAPNQRLHPARVEAAFGKEHGEVARQLLEQASDRAEAGHAVVSLDGGVPEPIRF